MAPAIPLQLPDAEVCYYPNFFSQNIATQYFNLLQKNTPWQQDDITVFGKTYAQPRLTALYGNNSKAYSYANIVMQPVPFTQTLNQIKTAIEGICPFTFTTCLLNLYRNGQDSNGWHADDEKELGTNPPIASVSFGAPRYFHLKHKKDKSLKTKILLDHGSLLLMSGATQHHYKHQIAKTAKPVGPRINLTFRRIV